MTDEDNGEPERLYAAFEMRVYDNNGDLQQKDRIEGPAGFSIEDVFKNTFIHGIDRIEIDVLAFEIRKNDEVKHRFETDNDGLERSDG